VQEIPQPYELSGFIVSWVTRVLTSELLGEVNVLQHCSLSVHLLKVIVSELFGAVFSFPLSPLLVAGVEGPVDPVGPVGPVAKAVTLLAAARAATRDMRDL
jgi:hypothetical protein